MVLCIDTVQRSLWSDFRFSYCLTWVTLVHIQETSMYIISISCPIQCFTSEPCSPLYRVFIISDPITRCFMLFCNIPIGLMELPKVPKNSSMVSYIYMIGVENFGWNETWDFCIMHQLSFYQ